MDEEDTDENPNIINFYTNKPNEKTGEKLLTKFNLSSKIKITKNNKYQNKAERNKLNPRPNNYLTNDPVYIEDFLLSIRLRFSDIFEKIEGGEKVLEDIKEESDVSNDIIKGAVFLRKLNFNENFPKKVKKKKIDVNKVIEIQKIFKGHMVRNVMLISNRLRLRQCLIELFCLLLYGYWYKAKLRYYINFLEKEYKIDKLIYIDELNFEDKIYFKLPKCFYSGTKINNLKSNKLGKERK